MADRIADGHSRGTHSKGDLVGIIGWIILGLIAGAIAKAMHSGDEPGGVLGYDALAGRDRSTHPAH